MITQNNLRSHRIHRGFSQLELARRAKIAPGIISNIENQKQYPYKGWRKRIARALNASEKEIFPEEMRFGVATNGR